MTISEVSKRYGLSQDTLRYYERVGAIPPVRRNASGLRDYSEADCRWVELTKCLRSAGLPIEAMIEYVRLTGQGDETLEARRTLLAAQRRRLEEQMEVIHSTMTRLDGKIAYYDDLLKARKG